MKGNQKIIDTLNSLLAGELTAMEWSCERLLAIERRLHLLLHRCHSRTPTEFGRELLRSAGCHCWLAQQCPTSPWPSALNSQPSASTCLTPSSPENASDGCRLAAWTKRSPPRSRPNSSATAPGLSPAAVSLWCRCLMTVVMKNFATKMQCTIYVKQASRQSN